MGILVDGRGGILGGGAMGISVEGRRASRWRAVGILVGRGYLGGGVWEGLIGTWLTRGAEEDVRAL